MPLMCSVSMLKTKSCSISAHHAVTDCALQHGARFVYAVDVGTNQLDYKLRVDDRVCVMEQTNFKETVIENFDPLPEVISIDVSFTSIVPILRHIESLFSQPLNIAALIKPQFESYLEEREEKDYYESRYSLSVIQRVLAAKLSDLMSGYRKSPITGTKGNTEYLFFISNKKENKYAITTKRHQFRSMQLMSLVC